MVLSKVFQEAGWVAMETTGLKFTSTIQLQAKPETIFTSHYVSSETIFVDRLILFSLMQQPLFVTPSALLPSDAVMKLFTRSVCFHRIERLEWSLHIDIIRLIPFTKLLFIVRFSGSAWVVRVKPWEDKSLYEPLMDVCKQWDLFFTRIVNCRASFLCHTMIKLFLLVLSLYPPSNKHHPSLLS